LASTDVQRRNAANGQCTVNSTNGQLWICRGQASIGIVTAVGCRPHVNRHLCTGYNRTQSQDDSKEKCTDSVHGIPSKQFLNRCISDDYHDLTGVPGDISRGLFDKFTPNYAIDVENFEESPQFIFLLRTIYV
jgi:hypothetical protein